MSLLESLSVDHPYYCSGSNYYSNEAAHNFETMSEFLDIWEDTDVDMNLVFRWDIRKRSDVYADDADGYCADVFIIHQRKGIFAPVHIENVGEDEAARFLDYALKHLEILKQIWRPLV